MKREPAGDRWCFGCRKRLPHDDVLKRDRDKEDDPALDYSWYDPWWSRECSGCGRDQTWFPGTGPL